MSQFASGFWDVYITVITLVSVVACAVFLKVQSVRRVESGTPQTTHTWDEDLTEYNNPLPRWWMWLFYLTVVFALIYLVLYPGLGSYRGLLGWSEVGQYEQETAAANKQYGAIYAKFASQDVRELAKNPDAMVIGQKLFLNNCAGCHASDAGGNRGFPNLTDSDWLWGGTPEAIKASITNGRVAQMPPFGPALGDAGTQDVANYVLSLSGQPHDAAAAGRGEKTFKTICMACHGMDGKGNQALGAPNLTDRIWLFTPGNEATIVETVRNGRKSQMPAHKDLLSAAKIHLLTAYVYSLSTQHAAPASN